MRAIRQNNIVWEAQLEADRLAFERKKRLDALAMIGCGSTSVADIRAQTDANHQLAIAEYYYNRSVQTTNESYQRTTERLYGLLKKHKLRDYEGWTVEMDTIVSFVTYSASIPDVLAYTQRQAAKGLLGYEGVLPTV